MQRGSKLAAGRSPAQALLGFVLAIALILKAAIPYLVTVSICIWLAGEVSANDSAWAWGLAFGALLGFLMFKARASENAKRDSAFSWHQGHYRGVAGIAHAGRSLLSQYQSKPEPTSRRDLGYEKDTNANAEPVEDSVRRKRRALGYDDPPPDA